MAFRRQWFLIFAALVLGGVPLWAASTSEKRAYDVAVGQFNVGIYDQAETAFAQFIAKYPGSTQMPMAQLLEAQAQYKQGKFSEAINLLNAPPANSGNLADRYAYWLGEAQFGQGDFDRAVATFKSLVNNFPDSALRLNAVVEAAAALAKLEDWPQLTGLLGASGGVFARAAETDAANELVSRGRLLLAQAQLAQKNYAGALAALKQLGGQTLSPDLDYQRASLLCEVELGAGDLDAALAATTNLLQIARTQKDASRLADSVAMSGTVLGRMGRWADAAAAWSENVTNTAPVERQTEAILKMAEAAVAQTNFVDAETALGKFLAQSSNSPAADLALLTLGELQLKEFVANPAATNQFTSAQANFDRLLATSTNGPLSGKAYLDRGWCYWLADKTAESLSDFRAAADRLPVSDDLAVAKFKAGDALYKLKDYSGATNYYRAVLDQFGKVPDVAQSLGDRALYQILRADMRMTNAPGAEAAMQQLLEKFPTSELRDNSLLLMAEGFSDWGLTTNAFNAFQDFTRLFPDSPLKPQVQLGAARTYEREQNWLAAITNYEDWLKEFPTNELRPQVEYALGWANYQAGRETNALDLFTAFVTRFPTNDLAPRAQWWVADHYFRLGTAGVTNFAEAEKNYELIFQTPAWKDSSLFYPAQLMAGLAAEARQGFPDAESYLTKLIADTNCPPATMTQAMLAYGGLLMRTDSSDTNRPFANFERATNVFAQIYQANPTNNIGALAASEMGDCCLQLGALDMATNLYSQVINSPYASIRLQSRAQVGLGVVLEKMAETALPAERQKLLKSAFDNYRAVLYTTNETADPYYTKVAGFKALPLMMTLKDGDPNRFFDALEYWLPQLKETLEKKRAALGN